jgi:hypothetical protein
VYNPNKISSPPECARLNQQIEFAEVMKAVRSAKSGKAAGCDNISVECLRSISAISFMCILFNRCFQSGRVPSEWKRGIINPIPKCTTSDPRDPLSYRGITLTPAIYKLYCSVLNARLSGWVENENILEDEQNGFRKGRSCQDHLSTVSMLIESRKLLKQSTFVSFIDFSKAYDRVGRNLLWHKLEGLGLNGMFVNAIKSLYDGVQAAVRVNGLMTDWFDVGVGLKQGCILSPVLFNIYLNDFLQEIKDMGVGVTVGEEKIAILGYADDIVLMAESEQDLQDMLSRLELWCNSWEMKVNISKTKVVHFRPQSTVRTDFEFKCGGECLEVVNQYKYLGLLFTEFMDYEKMAKKVAESASRALGMLIAKDKAQGGMPFQVFKHLYDGLVQSVMNFGAGIWGHREYACIESVHNRACRYFLGVGSKTPTAAVRGDIGWTEPSHRQWLCMGRQWHRLRSLNVGRLNRRVFDWARERANSHRICKNWVTRVETQLRQAGVTVDPGADNIALKLCLQKLDTLCGESTFAKWSNEVNRVRARRGQGLNKLRTYRLFKSEYKVEGYITCVMGRAQRRALAQFRSGVAPIRLETGRYERGRYLPVEERICYLCDNNAVESEIHVILECPVYNDIREDLFHHCNTSMPNFNDLSAEQKLCFILGSDCICQNSANFLNAVLKRRRSFMYNV